MRMWRRNPACVNTCNRATRSTARKMRNFGSHAMTERRQEKRRPGGSIVTI